MKERSSPLESRVYAASWADKTTKACAVAIAGLSISMSSNTLARKAKNSAELGPSAE